MDMCTLTEEEVVGFTWDSQKGLHVEGYLKLSVCVIIIVIDIIIIIKAYNLEIYKHGKNYKLIVIKLVFLICRAASYSGKEQ